MAISNELLSSVDTRSQSKLWFFVIHNYPEKLLPKYSVIGLRLAAKQDQLCVQVFSHIEGHGLIIN